MRKIFQTIVNVNMNFLEFMIIRDLNIKIYNSKIRGTSLHKMPQE